MLSRDDSGVPVAGYDPHEDVLKVSSLQKRWRADFTGSVLNPSKWNLVQQGTGQTITVSGGVLAVTSGTTANAETIIESVEYFTPSVRVLFQMMLSARVANNSVTVELVSVDPDTLVADGQNAAAWLFDFNATADFAKYEVQYGGQARLQSAAVDTNVNITTPYHIREIELYADEAWFHSRLLDSTAGRTSSFVRNQQIPDPNSLYKVRIRVTNGATAPASSITANFQGVTVVDYSELQAEITASRGANVAGMGLPVSIVQSITQTVSVSGNPAMQGMVAHDAVVTGNPVLAGAYAHATGQAAVSADGDVVRLWADRQGRLAVWVPPAGAHANGWSAAAVLAGGVSAALDTLYTKTVSIFGNASAATDLTAQYSQDNTNWYDSDQKIAGATGNFGLTFDAAARYIRVKSSAAATITLTIAAKS